MIRDDASPAPEAASFPAWHVSPAAATALLPPTFDLTTLVAGLESNHWEGELVGPPGVGKSLLLRELERHLAARAIRCRRWECSLDSPDLPPRWRHSLDSVDVILLDGADTLRASVRRTLRRACRERTIGLVVTTRYPLGLAASFGIRCSLAHAQSMVQRLFPDAGDRPAEATVERLYRSHGGNIREIVSRLHQRQQRILECQVREHSLPAGAPTRESRLPTPREQPDSPSGTPNATASRPPSRKSAAFCANGH